MSNYPGAIYPLTQAIIISGWLFLFPTSNLTRPTIWKLSRLVLFGGRHGNNAIRFHRHRIQIHIGSSICVFHADPEFQLKGNIGQDTEPTSKVPITLPDSFIVWWVPSSPNLPCLQPPEPIQHSCSSPPSPKTVHPVVKALNRDK